MIVNLRLKLYYLVPVFRVSSVSPPGHGPRQVAPPPALPALYPPPVTTPTQPPPGPAREVDTNYRYEEEDRTQLKMFPNEY